jgi:hypothetical protein
VLSGFVGSWFVGSWFVASCDCSEEHPNAAIVTPHTIARTLSLEVIVFMEGLLCFINAVADPRRNHRVRESRQVELPAVLSRVPRGPALMFALSAQFMPSDWNGC